MTKDRPNNNYQDLTNDQGKDSMKEAALKEYVELCFYLPPNLPPEDKISMDELLLCYWGAEGMQDYALTEQEIEKLLGDKAVSGGPLSDDIMSEMEDYCEFMQNKKATYYFTGIDAFERSLNARDQLLELFPQIKRSEMQSKKEENWVESWKQHYHPIFIDEEFKVFPSWYRLDQLDSRYFVRIDPGQAFGTGAHESTQLCLRLLKELKDQKHGKVSFSPPASFLDFGCGSGILGIAALLLFKEAKCAFMDLDAQALQNTQINLDLNFIPWEKRVSHLVWGDEQIEKTTTQLISSGVRYELIFANILLPTLMEKKDILLSMMSPGGLLIVSGILNNQWDELSMCYGMTNADGSKNEKSDLEVVSTASEKDWKGVCVRKKILSTVK